MVIFLMIAVADQELLSKHAATAIIKKNNHGHSLHFVDFLWLNKSDLQYQGEF